MVFIQSEIKRGFLRQIAYNAKQNAIRLYPALMAYQAQGFAALSGGRLVVSTGGGGFNTSFEIPAIGKQFTQDQVFALSEFLISLYDAAVYNILRDDPEFNVNYETADDTILAFMLASDSMQSVRAIGNDYTGLNFPGQGGFGL